MGLADSLGLTGPDQPDQPQIDPALLAQLMGLGSVDKRHQLLQQQLGRADQLSAGAPVDYNRGKGTPLLLAGLANLISSGVGGYQAGKAQAGEKALVDQGDQTRSAFSKALMGASAPVQGPPDDFVGPPAPGQDPASLESKRSGLLSALRSAGVLSGDPAIKGMIETGPKLALEDQRIAAGQREAEAATSPATGAALRGLAAKYGANVPEGTPNAAAEKIANIAEKGYTAEQSRLSRADVARIMAEGGKQKAIITATGTVPGAQPAGPVDPNALEPIPPSGKVADNYRKLAEKFQKDMDAAAASSRSAFGETAKVVFRGARNLAILNQKNPDGSQRQLTLPEWQEVTGGLIAMQTGGVPTERMMKEGLPNDVNGSAAGIMSWLTSSPHAPDRQAWIERFLANINREEETAKKYQRDVQMQRLPSNSEFFSKYPNRAKLAAHAYDIGPELIDQIRNGQSPSPAPGEKKKRWDPAAGKIVED
jgi:hypothetical protein